MRELGGGNTVDNVIVRLRSWVASRGHSKTRLAIMAGLPHHTSLRDFDSVDWNPTVALLRKLESLVPHDFICDDIGIVVKRGESNE